MKRLFVCYVTGCVGMGGVLCVSLGTRCSPGLCFDLKEKRFCASGTLLCWWRLMGLFYCLWHCLDLCFDLNENMSGDSLCYVTGWEGMGGGIIGL